MKWGLISAIVTASIGAYGAPWDGWFGAKTETVQVAQRDHLKSDKTKSKKASKAKKKAPRRRLAAQAPAGLPTQLPDKKWVDPAGVGQTQMVTATVLPAPHESKDTWFVANVALSYGTIDRKSVTGDQYITYATIQPLARFDMAKNLSLYGTIPFSWYSFNSTSENIRVMGRPELGLFATVINSDNLVLGTGVSADFPLFDTSWGLGIAERQRRWQFAPGVTADARLGGSTFHGLGAVRLALESTSQYTSFTPEGDKVAMTMTHAPVLRSMVGLAWDMSFGRVGLATHLVHGLGVSRVNDGTLIREELAAPSLVIGEIFGNYRIASETDVAASLSSGLRTAAPANLLWWLDNPRDTSTLTFNLSLNRNF